MRRKLTDRTVIPWVGPDGNLELPCGSVFARSERDDWLHEHLPYCGICDGNYGYLTPRQTYDTTAFT